MDDKKFDEMYEATMENNRMLKGMRRSAYVGGVIKAVWWVLILIVLPYLSWIYIQPYLDTIMNQYQQVQSTGAQYQSGANQLQELYNQYFGTSTKK